MMMKGKEEMDVAVGVETKGEEDGEQDSLDKDLEVENQNKKQQKRFVRLDSLDYKASHISGMATKTTKALSIAAVMKLAFQSIGVVYGDIGTSPLYVFASTFADRIPTKHLKRAEKIKAALEKSSFAKTALLVVALLGTCMVIGDGILTPCISDAVVGISVVILIFLFVFQRFGTDKVGYSFASIICIWFAFIAGIGVFNFIKYDPSVVKALNPKYIIDYFRRNKKQAWISLGGAVLAVTGTEALFADVGRFTVRSIQMSMCSITYPADLILAYAGQASYLLKHNSEVGDVFYKSIPVIRWRTMQRHVKWKKKMNSKSTHKRESRD